MENFLEVVKVTGNLSESQAKPTRRSLLWIKRERFSQEWKGPSTGSCIYLNIPQENQSPWHTPSFLLLPYPQFLETFTLTLGNIITPKLWHSGQQSVISWGKAQTARGRCSWLCSGRGSPTQRRCAYVHGEGGRSTPCLIFCWWFSCCNLHGPRSL